MTIIFTLATPLSAKGEKGSVNCLNAGLVALECLQRRRKMSALVSWQRTVMISFFVVAAENVRPWLYPAVFYRWGSAVGDYVGLRAEMVWKGGS